MNTSSPTSARTKWKTEFNTRLIAFSVSVLQLADQLRSNPSLWPVCDQLIRSSTSIGANIHEASGSASRRDFAHFFQIALKSAKETDYWLTVLEQYHTESGDSTQEIKAELLEITRIISYALLTMKGQK